MCPLQRFCSKPTTPPSLCHSTSRSSSSQPQESGPDVNARQRGRGAPGAIEELRAFCRQALYECITQEKPGSLPSYLLLFGLMQGILGADDGSGVYPHSLARTHGHTMHFWGSGVYPHRLARAHGHAIQSADNELGTYLHSLAHTHGHTMQNWVRYVSPKFCTHSWTYHAVC